MVTCLIVFFIKKLIINLAVILNNVDSRVKQLDQYLWTTIMHFHLNTPNRPPPTPNLLVLTPFKPAPLNSIGRLLSAWKVTYICRDCGRTGEEIFSSFSFFNHPPHTTRFARERHTTRFARERERERERCYRFIHKENNLQKLFRVKYIIFKPT